MKSRLFKRAHQEGTLSGKAQVKQAFDKLTKLSEYLDKSDSSFEHARWAAEAQRTLKRFLDRNTDVVTASVSSVVASVDEMYNHLASAEFDYEKMVDETSPNGMFDAPEGEFDGLEADSDVNSELKSNKAKVDDSAPHAESDHKEASKKVAESELMSGGSPASGPWADFPTDALTKVVKALSSSNDFATDKTVQTAVAEISKILSTRNPELEEAVGEEKQASAKQANQYIKNKPGHKDSEGKDAPWVVVDKSGKIINSHATKELAEESFGAMEMGKHSTLKRFKGLNLASVEDIIEPSGKNSLGSSPELPNDNIIEKKSSGTDATTVTELEVEEGDKSVTASGTDSTTVTELEVEEGDKSVTASGTDTTTVTELEVEEGDKSVEKSHTSKLLRGLRVAGIEG